MLTRVVIYEFTQALKSKVVLLEANFVIIINFILHVSLVYQNLTFTRFIEHYMRKFFPKDIGGILPTTNSFEDLLRGDIFDSGIPIMNTGAAEVLRTNFTDVFDFVADFHSLTKIKVSLISYAR